MHLTGTTARAPRPAQQMFPSPPPPPPEKPAGSVGTGRERRMEAAKPRALVVDDAPDITFLFSVLLQQEGYEVVTAGSGFSALDEARRGRFYLVVSDIGLQGMSGHELAKALRSMPEY
ncbi:MAG: response regulator, partial [Pyrinomonadaceae bacterium]